MAQVATESLLLYISTSVWVLRTPNAGRNSHFQCFLRKKAKKRQEICSKILQKTRFLSLHHNAGQLFYSQKRLFRPAFGVLSTQTLVEI